MMMKKRLALVTGGTRGIGKAISIALRDAGYEVAANYGSNEEIARKFHKETGIHAYKWDVANFKACNDGVRSVENALGIPVDILVNNAGITRDGMMHKATPQHWHEVIETNLTSCFNMAHAVIKSMREREFGRIINISSINALSGQAGQTNYSSAKAGILGLTRALALESASKAITVNAVAPGYIETEMSKAVPPHILENIISQIPVKRLGQPEDVARCVVFLAADNAGFITGETLSVNGGHHMY
jgi:acetoacetyl-CoA reductase